MDRGSRRRRRRERATRWPPCLSFFFFGARSRASISIHVGVSRCISTNLKAPNFVLDCSDGERTNQPYLGFAGGRRRWRPRRRRRLRGGANPSSSVSSASPPRPAPTLSVSKPFSFPLIAPPPFSTQLHSGKNRHDFCDSLGLEINERPVKKAMLDFSSLSVSEPSSAPNKGIYFYLSHAFFPFINI